MSRVGKYLEAWNGMVSKCRADREVTHVWSVIVAQAPVCVASVLRVSVAGSERVRKPSSPPWLLLAPCGLWTQGL